MADILAFALHRRPPVAVVGKFPRIGGRPVTMLFRWVRDPETGRLICRWDAEPAEPESHPFLRSA